ncbi:hypothetical protein D9619_008291 [Psilocybe cf. subviscida]|uniref:NACHT domain-containing protein n=1 Tax=Psilocybe cf. subviscida TaxID=2480587 RepID=A0A8H5F0X1_9AGAR|nr:hypothetical protein D9619_008291 [Psilocybe cf. subviscida]
MFNGARNVSIHGGSFVVNADSSTQSRLDRLFEVVAPNAILNAGGRADEVRCYPGTREDVINKMEKWMDDKGSRTSRMMWLSGPAGAGKSAILQTVAERCQEYERLTANFFFFRGDTTRNHAQPLVATLVYQLRALYPALDKILEDCLTAAPLVYKASIGEQFQKLISSPIHAVQNSSAIRQPILLMIDGLDECDDKTKQEQIVGALHALVESDDSPFLVLVASRTEPHIVMSFNNIAASVVSLFLDDEYRPQDDIRRFVIAKFVEIKRTHHLAHTLDEYWPITADIDAIVEKSSGQFIYAATVMRFIHYSTASPRLSLLTIRGIRPAADHSPYAQLDAIYSYVLSKSHNLEAIIFCLGVHFAATIPVEGWGLSQDTFSQFFQSIGYESIEIESLFADLVAIISVHTTPGWQLAFYHASLSDYLLDKSRSGIYHVDPHRIRTEIIIMCLKKNLHLVLWRIGVFVLCQVEEATPALSKCLLEAIKCKLDRGDMLLSFDDIWCDLMTSVYQLYFALDRALYRRMVRHWIRFGYINNLGKILLVEAVNSPRSPADMRSNIRTYYTWCLFTEGLKHALRWRKFTHTN